MDSFPKQLTELQREFLTAFFALDSRFCLIGGGALTYYLPERRARDLDLVAPADVVLSDQVATLRQVARSISAQLCFPERSADLLRCSVRRAGETLQVDLGTRTAQIRVGEKRCFGAIRVESAETLAAHKLVALCARARPRDLRDLHALLATGLSLAAVVSDAVRREPALDPAAVHGALSDWASRMEPEDREQLAELQPQLLSLLRSLRELCFAIASGRSPQLAAAPPGLSPLQTDVLHALSRKEARFCLTGCAALTFYAQELLPSLRAALGTEALSLWMPSGSDSSSALQALQEAAAACGGKARVVQAEPGCTTVRVDRDAELCLVRLLVAAHPSGPSTQQQHGALLVDAPPALAAHSLVAMWKHRSGAELLVLKAAIELGVSSQEAICDALDLEPAADLPGLHAALCALSAPDGGLAGAFAAAQPFRQQLVREVRRLAYEESRAPTLRRAHEILTRDGAKAVSGRAPILCMFGGGYGSGKSALKRRLTEQGELPASQAVRIEPDEILRSLPGYLELVKRGQVEEAGALHHQSNELTRRVLRRALELGCDIVYDTALGNPDRARRELQAARAAGYRIFLIGVTADIPSARARAAKRSARYGLPEIPIDSLLASHRSFSENFASFASLADRVSLYESNEEPLLIASGETRAPGESLVLQIHDEERYRQFLDKAENSVA